MLSGKRLGFDETECQCSILYDFYVLKVVHSMRADSEGLSGNMFRMDVLTSAGLKLMCVLSLHSTITFFRNVCEGTCPWRL